MTFTIYPVTTIEDCRRLEDLQIEIWGSDRTDVVPDHLLLTMAKNGGILLAAKEDERMIGFVFSFQGQAADGTRKHASHMAGVVADTQCKGVGTRLKLAQREAALAQGITLMTWTFDPLISRNANFNFRKLGATCRTYYRELYGAMRDGINQGLNSDRMQVDWQMDSERVQARIDGTFIPTEFDPALVLNRTALNAAGLPVPPDAVGSLTEARHFIEIPAHIDALKAADVLLAQAWRSNTRYLFETAFAAGYRAVDFVRVGDESYYVIERSVDA